MPTKAVKKAKKEDNLKPYKKGQSGNPKGYKKGQRNYATIYKEAIRKIAESKNMTPEELEDLLVQSGLSKAFKGDIGFYRDNFDRLYGKPPQALEHTGADGGPITIVTKVPVIKDKE